MQMINYPSMNVNLVSNRINAVEWLSQNTRLNLNVPSEGVREGWDELLKSGSYIIYRPEERKEIILKILFHIVIS